MDPGPQTIQDAHDFTTRTVKPAARQSMIGVHFINAMAEGSIRMQMRRARKTAKRVLKALGLIEWVCAVRDRRFMRRYRGRDQHTIRYGGLEVRFATDELYSKRWFYPRYENGRSHEPKVMDAILRDLPADGCFVDVGANVGYFTCFAAKVCHKVYAFEMDDRFARMLTRSVELNGLTNVELVKSAVGAAKGEVKYRVSDMPHLSGKSEDDGDSVVTVPMVSLDEFFRGRSDRPTLLKIDIQGAETMALRGMTSLLAHDRPRLLIEIHPGLLPGLGSNAQEPLDILFDAGYRLYQIEGLRGQTALEDVREVSRGWNVPLDTMLLAIPREQSDQVN